MAPKASNSTFYSTFWSLQKYFNNPHLLFTTTNSASSSSSSSSSASTPPIETLHSSLSTVLTAFSTETKKEKALSGSAAANGNDQGKSVDSSSSSKNVEASMVILGEKDSQDKTEQSLEQYFFPKFLTSRNLLSLEVHLLSPFLSLSFICHLEIDMISR